MKDYAILLRDFDTTVELTEATPVRIPAPFAKGGTLEMYLTHDYNIVSVDEKKLYVRDKSIPLEELMFNNIPDLSPDGSPVSLMEILASIYKPTGIDSEDYFTAYRPRVLVVNSQYREDPVSLIWQYPRGGIPFNPEGSLLYIPGSTDTLLGSGGTIVDKETQLPVELGRYHEEYKMKTSAGDFILINQEELVALGKGYYDLSGLYLAELRKDLNGDTVALPPIKLFVAVEGHTSVAE
ncbi:hypothetical protein [Vibrio phage vB_VmeM-Yong XC32]|nr:hypothetical protein [Vibrio phage vB_VmeM-Yong XC31]QAX96607.1 hypothetical protein [Vibrio phage vB_VmeM-Yong XC32]QAX96925.1 hypothetical protein [Vibrio phage vB_VmeM-Yong MS31]QAX97230.1 hypothetical protein [Vibrio phage vB_VmeM-Yong MS32]